MSVLPEYMSVPLVCLMLKEGCMNRVLDRQKLELQMDGCTLPCGYWTQTWPFELFITEPFSFLC